MGMTLFSLASRQIWPQVLAFLSHTPRPDHLVLFHSREENESAGPARRLKELMIAERLLPVEAVDLVEVAHDRFGNVLEAMASAAERLNLDGSNCSVNLTGGNKLMALAATEWCRLAEVRCFYLERDFTVLPFLPRGSDLLPQESYQINPHIAKDLSPLELLRCQLGTAEVVNPGQCLTLNERGKKMPGQEIQIQTDRGNFDFQKLLTWDVAEPEEKQGFALEYATAVALLSIGIPVVQRSVRLVPRVPRGSGREEGELDLVFNWGGKLWVVDCKDRKSALNRVDAIRTSILSQCNPAPKLQKLLADLEDKLRQKELHPLKEDLLAVSEVAGLLGQAICVRREPLPPQAEEFARSRRLHVVTKNQLLEGLRRILYPGNSAAQEAMRNHAAARATANHSQSGPDDR